MTIFVTAVERQLVSLNAELHKHKPGWGLDGMECWYLSIDGIDGDTGAPVSLEIMMPSANPNNNPVATHLEGHEILAPEPGFLEELDPFDQWLWEEEQ